MWRRLWKMWAGAPSHSDLCMRVDVQVQDTPTEVVQVEMPSNTGVPYRAAQLILHHNIVITFWLPESQARREEMAIAFEGLAEIFRDATPHPTQGDK